MVLIMLSYEKSSGEDSQSPTNSPRQVKEPSLKIRLSCKFHLNNISVYTRIIFLISDLIFFICYSERR